MQTFFTVLLVFFLLVVFGVIAVGLFIRSKARKFLAKARVAGLEAAINEIKQRAEKPENAGNQEIAALLARVETAHAQAKTACDKGDYATVSKIADPLLKELLELASKLADEAQAEREAERARQAADADGLVIEGTAVEVKDPVALLPAPDATTAPVDGATTPAADVKPAGTEGDGTQPKQ